MSTVGFFAHTTSKILQMVNICEVVYSISSEAILGFPKDVVDFGFYAVS